MSSEGHASEIKPHEIAAQQILGFINSNPDYNISDLRTIVGSFYPRRLASGGRFNYIFKRIIYDDVLPKLEDKQQKTDLMGKEVVYERDNLKNARIDKLTGLYRREYFFERVEEEAKKHPKMRIVMMDLDRLKVCNDTFGHNTGDEVLAEVGTLMSEIFTDHEVFCRWGGEEFVMAVPDSVTDFESRLDSFRRDLASRTDEIIPDNKSEFHGTVSVGIYDADFTEGKLTTTEAIRHADKAVYEAKKTRDSVVVWSPDLK